MPETSTDAQMRLPNARRLAVLLPLCAWFLTALPWISFIWSALGKVSARHAFLSEVADYFVIASVPGLVGSAFVIPVAVCVWTGRASAGTWRLALGVLSVLAYGVSNFAAFGYYSLRIT